MYVLQNKNVKISAICTGSEYVIDIPGSLAENMKALFSSQNFNHWFSNHLLVPITADIWKTQTEAVHRV